MIAIVDIGLCNAGSIVNMLRHFDVEVVRTSSPSVIKKASKLILPGIGSFDAGMSRLTESGLIPVLNEQVLVERVQVLGICLGMQMMTKSSEEGQCGGLGWIDARTRRFAFQTNEISLRVPHMGWNNVEFSPDAQLAMGLLKPARFYFVHSYYVELSEGVEVMPAYTHYGNRFLSSFSSDNIHGVQFHPEKSHRFGIQLFHNFAKL
jgi:glutamine amidotransferase